MIQSVKGKRHPLLRKLWKQRAFFLMLLPGIAYYIIYKYAPIVLGVATSVVKYNLRKGLAGSKLLNPWYSNFKFFFESNYFSQLLSNTLIISLSKILLTIPIALLLAILLYECRSVKLRRCVQTLTYIKLYRRHKLHKDLRSTLCIMVYLFRSISKGGFAYNWYEISATREEPCGSALLVGLGYQPYVFWRR